MLVKPHFIPTDWYWHITDGKHRLDVEGTPVLEEVYSSAKGDFVPADDPDYQAWINNSEIGDLTTPIDTIDDLKMVLAGWNLEFGKPA